MKKGKIFVVDDNQGIRTALKLLLMPQFAEVEVIASPKTLVATMERFRPNVVLLDMNFAKASGEPSSSYPERRQSLEEISTQTSTPANLSSAGR